MNFSPRCALTCCLSHTGEGGSLGRPGSSNGCGGENLLSAPEENHGKPLSIYIIHHLRSQDIPGYSRISQVSHVRCGLDDFMMTSWPWPKSAQIQISDLPAFCHGAGFSSFHPALSQAQRLIRGVCVNVANTHYTYICLLPTVQVCFIDVSCVF